MAAPDQGLVAALVIAAAAFDLRSRRIPNWLTAGGVAGGLLCNFALLQWVGLRAAALGIGVALLVYLPLYALRAVGGGDVKLMAAVGSIAGPGAWIVIFCITAVAGGVIALVMVISRGRLRRTLRNVGFLLNELAHLRAPYARREDLDVTHESGMRLPHACSIAVGALLYLGASLSTGR